VPGFDVAVWHGIAAPTGKRGTRALARKRRSAGFSPLRAAHQIEVFPSDALVRPFETFDALM
jgi:hypothetical protein